jgi:superfamily II DNA/RNA helicase
MHDAKSTCKAIHGDVPPEELHQIVSIFRDEKFKVLAAADIIARGFDFPHIFLVESRAVRPVRDKNL